MTVVTIPVSAPKLGHHERAKMRLRVAIKSGGTIQSELVSVAEGEGEARFEIEGNAPISVAVGPEAATAADLFSKATMTTTISSRTLADHPVYRAPPIIVTEPIWHTWLRWCRSFTISGYVLGPDGNPVPSAAVNAYNVDYIWWWSSASQVGGTAITDASGYFSITFEWCCGWLPWYWWGLRDWRLDPVLVDKITPMLAMHPQLAFSGPSVRPVLGFTDLNPQPEPPGRRRGSRVAVAPTALSPAALPALRAKLLTSLPVVPEFERLCLWPWCDWWPWLDCDPNIIFNVTQSCGGLSNVIVQEYVWDARRDIPTTLNVTLYANADACTIPAGTGQPEGDCFLFTQACGIDAESIATPCDTTVPAAPGATSVLAGLVNPGATDQPFAGNVFISGQFGTAAQADYYTITYRPLQPCPATITAPDFTPVPPAALSAFQRTYFDATQPYLHQWFNPVFAPVNMPVGGGGTATVYQSRQYYETTNPGPLWGDVMSGRSWTGNTDGIGWIESAGFFESGQYEFQIVGYTANGDGSLTLIGPLAGCGAPSAAGVNDNNDFALYFANPLPVNLNNPEAVIASVVFTIDDPQQGATTTTLPACGILKVPAGGTISGMAISFTASDAEGFLDDYDMSLQWGTNGPDYITGAGTLTPTPIVGPSYAAAVSQGAVRPFWFGGSYVLTITDPATLAALFPETCAYELQLNVYKRNIVNCDGDDPYQNSAYYSFTVLLPT